MRLDGASTLPVMDEDEQSIVALAKSYLAQGIAVDMPSALMMAREYAAKSRAAASAQADSAMAAGAAKADARQAQRAMAQGVVPMEGETAADTQFRNRPLDQQEATLGFQQDTADNVTRGIRDGSVRQPGSNAWNEEASNWYAGDHGIDEAGDAQIVRDLARRLGREPRPEEVADEKKWRGWVNENPGSERQARYNKAGYDAQYEANQRQFNDAERKKYGAPINTSTIDPVTGEWTKPLSVGDLTPEQQKARRKLYGRTPEEAKYAEEQRQAEDLRRRLRVSAGLSAKDAAGMDTAALRSAAKDKSADDIASRTRGRLQAAKLAGGSHMLTGQGQGVANRLMELNPEARVRALLYSGPGGALAAQVDAAHNQQLTELGQRVAVGQGFQQMTPAQQALLNAQVDAAHRQKPEIEQMQLDKDKPVITEAELKQVDDHVARNYSWRGNVLGIPYLPAGTKYTQAEQQKTVDWLVNELDYKPEKAMKIVAEIARRRAQGPGADVPEGGRARTPQPPLEADGGDAWGVTM